MAPLPEITLRPAIAEDALCIAVLGMQVFLDTYATEGLRLAIAREVLESFAPSRIAAAIESASERFVLSESAGHLIGFAQWASDRPHEMVDPPGHVAELDRLYVQEPFTGRGVGRALLARAEADAAQAGASAMWLTAWIGNERALRFYPRCGYVDRGATIFSFQGEHHENRLFVKALIDPVNPPRRC